MVTPELMTGPGLMVQVTEDSVHPIREGQEEISHLPALWLRVPSWPALTYFLAVQSGRSCLASLCLSLCSYLENGHKHITFLVIWSA